MKQSYLIILLVIALGCGLYWWGKTSSPPEEELSNDSYVAVGSANPGEIILYKAESGKMLEQKRVNTGYKFVFTVRIGDLYNSGNNVIIAGVGDSFYKEPYGCHLEAYDLDLKKIEVIDTLSDLRCKDVTIDDISQDGTNEVVLGTHGEGKIQIYRYIADKWQKEVVDHNYIAQVDDLEGTSHRVTNSELPCHECIVQSAVHIVKIVDTDGVGEKEIIATISSPLELMNEDEISFVVLYRKGKEGWEREIIDRAVNLEFRSIEVGDIDHNGIQDIIVGTGSPRDVPAALLAYEYVGNAWKKKDIFTDTEAKNMKGLVVTDYDKSGKDSVIVATGFPDSKLYQIGWNGSNFSTNELQRMSSLIQDGGDYNAMAAIVIPGTSDIVTAGMSTFPDKKIGWEASDKGFLVYHTNIRGTLSSEIVSTSNILSMDLFTE